MEAVSLFQKQLPIMDIAHRLPELYQKYSGFTLDGQDISIWFDAQCIHIAQGDTAKFVSSPKILPWQTAAERIGALMEEGHFATNTEVAEAPGYMLRKLAMNLHLIRDDMRSSTREAGYLATIVGEYTGAYTDSTENTMKSLSDPASRETIVQEYKTFLAAYQADRQLMRGHYHDFNGTLRLLEELSLPRREYVSDWASTPAIPRFITDDEIDDALISYTPFVNSKQRIYQFFQEAHTSKERADMLKSEYGIGGKSNLWTDGSGIRFQSSYAPEVKMSWSKVAARIGDLIQNDRYLTPEEQKHLQEQEAQSRQPSTPPGEIIHQDNSTNEPPQEKPEIQPEIPESQKEITQEDIDEALTTWRDWMPPKQEVIAYMQEHGRERATAAWLAQVYGFSDAKSPMQITVSGIREPAILTWPKVQRRVAQLIQEDRFLTTQEKEQIVLSAPRPPRHDPRRFSVRELPDGSGDLAIWDATHRVFHHRNNALIRFDNAVSANNYLSSLQSIAKDARDGTLEYSAFHVGANITYHINDTFRSQRNPDQKSDCVIDYVTDDHVWYTIPDEPRREPYSIRRGHFELCLEDGTFYLTDPYEKLIQNVRQAQAHIPSALPSEESPGQFAFGGYHFVPIGNFKESYDLEEVMRSQIRSDPELGISKYDWGTAEYSHAAFYEASGNSTADIFLCVENGRCYLPGENELFHYTGDFQEIKQEKTVPEQTSAPTIRELYDRYLPFVREGVEQDAAYLNACAHSDRDNAVLECNAAIRRVVLEADDAQLLKLFLDMPDFRRRLRKDILEQTYQPLHNLLRPLSQEDIDDALRVWNGNMASKRAVVRYLKAHAQEEDAAEWLSRKYDGDDNSGMISVRSGSPEGTLLPWPVALSRISQLIQANDFYTAQELENRENIDPIALLEEAQDLIQGFCIQEYSHDADFNNLSEIEIAFTNEEDTDLPIQVNVDLVNFRIDRYLHDVRLEPRQYASLQELIDNELIALDFNDLVYVSEEEIESYYRQKELPIPIAEFRRSNGRWVQGWEVPSIGAEYKGTSAEIYFADRRALYEAVRDFERANKIPNPVIHEDGSYTDKEFLYSAYDEYVGMSHRHELEAYVPRFVNLAEGEPVEPYLAHIYYAKQNGLREDDIDAIIAEANTSGQPYTIEKMSAARLILEDSLDRWNPEINPDSQVSSFEEILEDDLSLPWTDDDTIPSSHEDSYRLLGRLKADCEYFLGYGDRAERHLWAGNVHGHIQKMRELYDLVPEKPEWLTQEQIDSYEQQMAPRYQVVTYHHIENGFDDKLDYQTLKQAEKAAQGYVDGTADHDGFQYEGAAIYDLRDQKYIRIYGDYPDERAQKEVLGIDAEPETVPTQTFDAPKRDPLAPPYAVGDTVYLDNTAFEITEVGSMDVQLRDPTLIFPIFRAESRERFEMLLQKDSRNGSITEFLSADLNAADSDLQEVLTDGYGLLAQRDKDIISQWFRNGEGNTQISQRMSETYAGSAGSMALISGEEADFRATTVGLEIEIEDKYLTAVSFRWSEIVPILRAMFQQERDGFSHNPVIREQTALEGVPAYKVGDEVIIPYPDRDLHGTIGYIGETDVRIDSGPYLWSHVTINKEQLDSLLRQDERNAHLFAPKVREVQAPQFTPEPEHIPPAPAVNFHITDEALGVGGAKAKFQKNLDAIRLLKELEGADRHATPEEQEVLSRYVGWGGVPDAFDSHKANWSAEYTQLKELLTPEEYTAARASTLNAHYTSPTVIRAIYDVVGNMGFQKGNILEPAMGVGNFFGMLPEQMQGSKLYGVELDSISGRIARKLYPQANITIAGFETTDRRDFYDLAIGNVPFGQYKVHDPAYNKLGFNIHNYFFAKALDQVRPGGVVAFVTSRYTMDAQNPTVRKYLAQRANLVGAIRLPNDAFKANAGTEVVSDILFLQKRDRPIEIDPDWVHLGQDENGYAINSYFIDHPEMVMGRNAEESTAYGKDYTVEPLEGVSLADQLKEAVRNIQGSYQEAEIPDIGDGEAIRDTLPADPDVKNYSYTLVKGEIYFRENSIMVRPDLNKTAQQRVKGMIALRTCVHELIALQMDEHNTDDVIQEKQKELNRLYDAYTAKYGIINNRGNKLAFSDDSSYFLLCALEIMDDEGNFKRKADMFTKRTIQPHKAVTAVDTASEALTLSIAEKAQVDMEYMSRLTGKTPEELAHDLQGVIFKDPTAGDDPLTGWQTADEYLSGNVRQKLRQAEAAAADDPAFLLNVEALQAAQPKDLEASEIDVRLGATWIDKSYIQQFMFETFDPPDWLKDILEVNYARHTAAWNITAKRRVSYTDITATSTYGTSRLNAYDILEDSLNLRDVRVYDTVEDAEGHERRVINMRETTLAAQKQEMIREAFKDWIWADPERRQALVQQYNEEMNSTRPREYDGSHIVFAGMNPEICLREHQRNAIAHTLYGGNTLLAHEVGAGKTFEMVASAMEAKRLGLCRKSIFVVPNHLTEQWASEFLRLYPSANLLVTKQRDFQTQNRKKFCARIATGDYDAVIIGHSQFERIPISYERQEKIIEDQIQDIIAGIQELEDSDAERFTVKQLERTKRSLEERLVKLKANHRKDDVVTFEQLGVDRLFVDEAHSYKNMFFYTKMQNVAGLSTSDAQKSSDMFAKCRYMDELTGSRGVIFATGTPVSNSMTELFTMQRYLQHARLEEMEMIHFDCWASRFGETKTALELAPEGYTLIGR